MLCQVPSTQDGVNFLCDPVYFPSKDQRSLAYIFFSRYSNITALKTDLYLLHSCEKVVKFCRVDFLSSSTELSIHFFLPS